MRCLKPGGSIFVNLGDKYASYEGNRGRGGEVSGKVDVGRNSAPKGAGLTGGGFVRSKSLFGLPWRYAIRCIDDLGLILRAEIVWAKPNGLPESVTDRVRRSHEQVFHFVKQARYFSAVDEVREEHSPNTHPGRKDNAPSPYHQAQTGAQYGGLGAINRNLNPLGKLPGSVWTIPTSPLRVPESLGIDHFAAYPPELVRRIVLGWSPREVCTACGEGRRPVSDRDRAPDRPGRVQGRAVDALLGGHGADGRAGSRYVSVATITGYACGCPDTTAPSTPGVVLDPFGGTGTTALVASCYGRVGISVDLSADYCRLAQWRTSDPGERARVLGVEKPPMQVDGQQDLFGELTA
jgi:hypothetical protein